ncbi:hypothetical protein [Agromyces laixinhei]|uniref:hypothetical protein n=1 Tax=Agromyces laixinhei TaxID=2585717 RepID=UPI0012ED1F77|nr:hypothetical protein [Agromyces laixinhei]
MMLDTDVVLRTLVDAALAGRRSWANVGDLAWEARAGEKLAYKALSRPASIGAVTKHPGGGFSVTDPERVLMLLAARRSLSSARRTTLESAQAILPRVPEYAIGGTRAAVQYLGGRNVIADHAPALVYVPESIALDDLPSGETALVLAADERALRAWETGFTSRAQTYADLFAQPGWQASEFRRALWRQWFDVDDWARAEASGD